MGGLGGLSNHNDSVKDERVIINWLPPPQMPLLTVRAVFYSWWREGSHKRLWHSELASR